MQIILCEFMSLDGVVQAPGGRKEDTDGGFAHGGWSTRYFDPETMGASFDEVMKSTDAMLFGRRTWQAAAAAWPTRSGDPYSDRSRRPPLGVPDRTPRSGGEPGPAVVRPRERRSTGGRPRVRDIVRRPSTLTGTR